jgi:hypothetical protein
MSRTAGVFVTVQLPADSIEIRSPAVAYNRVAAVKLDAGNQGGISAKCESRFQTERRLERITDVPGLLL